MKVVFGLMLAVLGIALGLYVGLWVCFIGGIVDIINELKADRSVEALTIAWGLVKIVFAGFAGWASALLLIIPGFAMVNSD